MQVKTTAAFGITNLIMAVYNSKVTIAGLIVAPHLRISRNL